MKQANPMKLFKPLSYYEHDFGKQLQATIVWAQVFILYCVVLLVFTDPTESEKFCADPFLKIAPIHISVWLAIILSLALAIWCFRSLGKELLLKYTPTRQIISGIAVAVIVGLILRSILGESLPYFVPAEESSKPGFLYGMVAGYSEELYFRMLIAPLVFFVSFAFLKSATPKKRVLTSIVIAILITALAFNLFHEIGEADNIIVWKIFATRFMVPGLIMGSLYFWVGPGFVIFMHSTIHIMIPLLFH